MSTGSGGGCGAGDGSRRKTHLAVKHERGDGGGADGLGLRLVARPDVAGNGTRELRKNTGAGGVIRGSEDAGEGVGRCARVCLDVCGLEGGRGSVCGG